MRIKLIPETRQCRTCDLYFDITSSFSLSFPTAGDEDDFDIINDYDHEVDGREGEGTEENLSIICVIIKTR